MMKGGSQPTSARKPCVDDREVIHEASVAVRADGAIEHRNVTLSRVPRLLEWPKATPSAAEMASRRRARRCQRTQGTYASPGPGPGRVVRHPGSVSGLRREKQEAIYADDIRRAAV